MKKNENLSIMIKVALLGAIASLLMLFKFPLPFAPPFMDIDISEVPGIIAGFIFGPFWGFVVIVIKLLLKFITQGSGTGGFGELSNLIVSAAFVVTASLIYKRKRTFKNAIFALSVGVVLMTILATLSNYFIIFPLYGIPMQTFAPTMAKINPFVKNVPTLILFSIVPFNIIKGILNSVIAVILYKPLLSTLGNCLNKNI